MNWTADTILASLPSLDDDQAEMIAETVAARVAVARRALHRGTSWDDDADGAQLTCLLWRRVQEWLKEANARDRNDEPKG